MKLLFALLLALSAPLLHAAEIPFSPEVEARLNGERVNYAYVLKHMAHAVYDASVYGGTCATDYTLLTIPANAIVTNANFYIDNRFSVSGGSGIPAMNVYCGTYGAGYTFLNGYALDQIGTTGNVYSGPIGASSGLATAQNGSSWIALSGVPCDLKVRTNAGGQNSGGSVNPGGSGTITVNSGKFDLYLEYVLHQ